MGTLKRFAKFKLSVFGDEHGRVHFHLAGPDFNCALDLETMEILAGSAPAGALRLARQWAGENRALIEDAWKEWNQ